MASKALCCLAIAYLLGGSSIPLAYGQQSAPSSTAELLRSGLALQRDIAVVQHSIRDATEPDRVKLVLDMDGRLSFTITHIQLTLDGDTIVDQALDEADNRALQQGAMIPLHDGVISRGKHHLTAIVSGIGAAEQQRQKRFKFDKPKHADTIKLSIAHRLVGKQPGINMQIQHRGVAK